MSKYTLNELMDLAKFRVERLIEIVDGDDSFYIWDEMSESDKLAHAAALDKLLDEVEERKTNPTIEFDFSVKAVAPDSDLLYNFYNVNTIEDRRKPQVWDSLLDVAPNTTVRDCEGDFWRINDQGQYRFRIAEKSDWNTAWDSVYDAGFGPFTEVLDA